jgi:hypothetical protein
LDDFVPLWNIKAIFNHKNFVSFLLVLIAGSTLFVQRKMAGHDETAHITMWQEALKNEKIASRLTDAEFNQAVYGLMEQEKFYALNGIMPKDPNECPHSILGSCGITPKPIQLYQNYIYFLKTYLSESLVPISPKNILRFVWFMHAVFLLGFMFFAHRIFDARLRDALLGSMILCGAFWGQFGTLTNDVPMYFLGFIGLASICSALTYRPLSLQVTAYLAFFGGYLLLKDVDVSQTIALLPLALGFFLIGINAASRDKSTNNTNARPFSSPGIYVGLMVLSIVVATVFLLQYLANHLEPGGYLYLYTTKISRLNGDILQGFTNIQGLLYANFARTKSVVKLYLYSMSGSFVWGHSYYPKWYQHGWSIFWCLGFFYLPFRYAKQTLLADFCRAILWALGIGLALTAIVAIGAKHAHLDIVPAGSFVKPRLTAPGIALTMSPIFLILYHLLGRDRSKALFNLGILLVAVFNMIYQFKIFYLDV